MLNEEKNMVNLSFLEKNYFADGYEFDKTNEVYKLKGNIKQGTFSEMKDEFGTYQYTCRNTSSTGSCEVLIKVNSLVSETSIKAQYYSYTRLYQNKTKTANLKCSDVRDRFSITSDYGNANLTYPVALITADEVMLAGDSYSDKNENYYLHTNGYFWTMTPSFWTSSYAFSFVNDVYPEGIMASYQINSRQGLRAVINIRPDVLISCGDGTMDSPYQLRLK